MRARHLVLAAALTAWPLTGFAQEAPLTLAELERLALERNPTLEQARAGVDEARGLARQAGLLPNPTVGYQGDELGATVGEPRGEHGFFVEQRIPLGGRLRLAREVFEREAAVAESLEQYQQQRVLLHVRLLYREALVAARQVEIREQLARLTNEAVAVSAQLYNVGAADHPDVLEIEVEAQGAQAAVVEARNHESRVWRRLALVVGDSSLRPRPLAGAMDEEVPEIDREAALRSLLADSPELRAARAAVARAEAALALARREPAPDLVLRASPRFNRDTRRIGDPAAVGWEYAFSAGVTVPIFNRNQGGIAAAEAALRRANAEVQRVELALEARLADAFERYLSALRIAEAYRDGILWRADQAYQMHLARFRQMAAAYPQVLIAQRTFLQASERYLEALRAAHLASAAIEGLLVDDGLAAPELPGGRTFGPGAGVEF